MPPLSLVFMGSPPFALPVLDALIAAGHGVARVYTQPPRPAGRGKKERRSAVHARAEALGLAVRTPETLSSDAEIAEFRSLSADAAVVAAYGLILPKAVLDAPRLGCLNVHASLLPRWRGAAPIERAILEGDDETGVTIMRVTEPLDAGPLLLSETVPITAETTAGGLHDQLSLLGAALMVDALDGVARGTITERPQPDDGVTYAHKITPADGRLHWGEPAAALARRVRALDPRPGAWFDLPEALGGGRVKVWAATVEDTAGDAPPGTVVDGALGIACGEGVLRPLRLQRAGRAAQDAAAFLRGFAVAAGTRLAG